VCHPSLGHSEHHATRSVFWEKSLLWFFCQSRPRRRYLACLSLLGAWLCCGTSCQLLALVLSECSVTTAAHVGVVFLVEGVTMDSSCRWSLLVVFFLRRIQTVCDRQCGVQRRSLVCLGALPRGPSSKPVARGCQGVVSLRMTFRSHS
jgi:hypothetical protein